MFGMGIKRFRADELGSVSSRDSTSNSLQNRHLTAADAEMASLTEQLSQLQSTHKGCFTNDVNRVRQLEVQLAAEKTSNRRLRNTIENLEQRSWNFGIEAERDEAIQKLAVATDQTDSLTQQLSTLRYTHDACSGNAYRMEQLQREVNSEESLNRTPQTANNKLIEENKKIKAAREEADRQSAISANELKSHIAEAMTPRQKKEQEEEKRRITLTRDTALKAVKELKAEKKKLEEKVKDQSQQISTANTKYRDEEQAKTQAESQKNNAEEARKDAESRLEAEKKAREKEEKRERVRQTDVSAANDRALQAAKAETTAAKTEVTLLERFAEKAKREADVEIAAAVKGRIEAEKKLANIRDGHDSEKALYRKEIYGLKVAAGKVKLEVDL